MYAAQYATPRQLLLMQDALKTSEKFREKSKQWEKEHGLGYHLMTVALILTTGLFGIALAMRRMNPYKDTAEALYNSYRDAHDEIAKANGLPTSNEIARYVAFGIRPKAWGSGPLPWDNPTTAATPPRPQNARRPRPAGLAA